LVVSETEAGWGIGFGVEGMVVGDMFDVDEVVEGGDFRGPKRWVGEWRRGSHEKVGVVGLRDGVGAEGAEGFGERSGFLVGEDRFASW
jgi:hypothetical protein